MTFNGQIELGYQLPELSGSVETDIPLTPSKVEKWVAQLPILNTSQLAQDIPKYIKELNQIELSDKNRFEILEQLRPVVTHLYEALTKQLRGTKLDLSVQSEEIKWLADVLVSEMATGYQHLLFNQALKKAGMLNRKQYVLFSQRVSFYLSERIYLAYLLSNAVPEGVWKDFNSTYIYCRKYKLNTGKVQDKIAYLSPVKSDIDCIYNRVLFLTLVSPYSLRSAELEQIYYGLLPWFNDMKLSEIRKPMDNEYVVDLKQDKGVEFQRKVQDGNNKYLVNGDGLVKKLKKWFESGDGQAPASAKEKGMSRNLLAKIIARLDGTSQRSDERLYNPGERVEAIVGLQNIDVFLAYIKLLAKKEKETPTFNAELEPQVKEAAQEDDIDNWDTLQFYVENHPARVDPSTKIEAEEEEDSSKPEIKHHSFNIKNESRFGVCLSCSYQNGEGLFIGELMLIRGYDLDVWTLGIVRGMMVKDKKLEIGLYLLSAKVDQVTINQENSGSDITVNALWLAEGEYGDTLLLPTAGYTKGDTLELDHKGESLTVSLGDVVWHSEGFSQFRFGIGGDGDNSSSAEEFSIPEWAK